MEKHTRVMWRVSNVTKVLSFACLFYSISMAINLHLPKAKTEWWTPLCSYSKHRLINAYVLPNTKAAFHNWQATNEKSSFDLIIKKDNHLQLAWSRGKAVYKSNNFFAQNEQLNCFVFSLSYLLLQAVPESRIGRNAYWKWRKFFAGASQTGWRLNWIQMQKLMQKDVIWNKSKSKYDFL